MYIKSLTFENYRNLENTIICPSETINVIYGNNAQGKTNFLEAIWLFTGGRSFRGSKDSELIRFGCKYAKIKAEFFSEGREQTIEIRINNTKRNAVLNDVPKAYMSQIVGKFCSVVFSPNHLTLIKNGPDERRNFTDSAICQIKPLYAGILSRYKKILSERNALLKDIQQHKELENMLDIWDNQLAAEGALIAFTRKNYIDELKKKASLFYSGISSGKESIDINYKMNVGKTNMNYEELKENMIFTLQKKKNDDIYSGFTTTGIHRDDISVKINGKEAKNFGSQGQQRSAVLAMKLAEADILGEKRGERPIILLDDVLSELDSTRKNYLLKKLDNMQVFITCCENGIECENSIYMENGKMNQ